MVFKLPGKHKTRWFLPCLPCGFTATGRISPGEFRGLWAAYACCLPRTAPRPTRGLRGPPARQHHQGDRCTRITKRGKGGRSMVACDCNGHSCLSALNETKAATAAVKPPEWCGKTSLQDASYLEQPPCHLLQRNSKQCCLHGQRVHCYLLLQYHCHLYLLPLPPVQLHHPAAC
jgi:hypothetical protein